jgi:gas vesicle protein
VADPTVLTAIVGAAAALLGAGTPIVIERRNHKKSQREEIDEAAEESIASWNSLNEALGREIKRLQDTMDRQRTDYETQLDAARKRITELESDLASLRRILGQPRP